MSPSNRVLIAVLVDPKALEAVFLGQFASHRLGLTAHADWKIEAPAIFWRDETSYE